MICRNCGETIPDNLECCPKCGSKTGYVKKAFCTKCGAEMNESDEFCPSCGAYTTKKKTEIEAKNDSVYGTAALGFIVPIIGFIIAVSMSKSNPKGAKVVAIVSLVGFLIEAGVFLPSILGNFLLF